jgi:hypothetical protein
MKSKLEMKGNVCKGGKWFGNWKKSIKMNRETNEDESWGVG